MSNYQMRKWQRQERLDDEPCPRCGHRMGGHRGMPSDCIEDPSCTCHITFEDLNNWRKAGKVGR